MRHNVLSDYRRVPSRSRTPRVSRFSGRPSLLILWFLVSHFPFAPSITYYVCCKNADAESRKRRTNYIAERTFMEVSLYFILNYDIVSYFACNSRFIREKL